MRIALLQGPLGLETEHHRTIPASREDLAGHRFVTGHANIGDWFVTRVTCETLDAEVATTIAPDAPDAAFDVINRDCDLMILKGGNFLSPGWVDRYLPLSLLKKIKIPIVYIGAGIQTPTGSDTVDFTKGDQASLKYIHASSKSCMVRGASTAEALARIGIDNVRVLGCPTIFWSRRPTIHVRRPRLEEVGWTFRNTLYSAADAGRRAQFAALEQLRLRSRNLTVLLQGEEVALQAYHLYDRYGTRYQLMDETNPELKLRHTRRVALERQPLTALVRSRLGDAASAEQAEWIARHSFFSVDVAAYVAMAERLDFVAGCRLHGNMVALSHGTPAFFFIYDERVREMADLIAAPHKVLSENDIFIPVDDLDYGPFERRYAELYAGYKAFLDENGIRHRLA